MEIIKKPIIGFAILQTIDSVMRSMPLLAGDDWTVEGSRIPPNAKFENIIIPAQPNSYAVYGVGDKSSDPVLIGYEYPGVRHPNWKQQFVGMPICREICPDPDLMSDPVQCAIQQGVIDRCPLRKIYICNKVD